jgi:hypothetical protein
MRCSKVEAKLSYANALKIMGFGSKPTLQELSSRWKELAKKYHPDLAKQQGIPADVATRKMAEVNQAKNMILSDLAAPIIDKKLLGEMIKEAQASTTAEMSSQEVEEKIADIIQKKYREDEQRAEYLQKAGKRIIGYKEAKDLLHERTSSVIKQKALNIASGQLKTKEDFEADRIRQISELINFQMFTIYWMRMISRLMHGPKRLRVHVQRKSKPHGRWIPLTIGLVLAIAAGKYVYDHRTKSIKPKLLMHG